MGRSAVKKSKKISHDRGLLRNLFPQTHCGALAGLARVKACIKGLQQMILSIYKGQRLRFSEFLADIVRFMN